MLRLCHYRQLYAWGRDREAGVPSREEREAVQQPGIPFSKKLMLQYPSCKRSPRLTTDMMGWRTSADIWSVAYGASIPRVRTVREAILSLLEVTKRKA